MTVKTHGRRHRRILGALAVALLGAGLMVAATAQAEPTDLFDCYADVGDPAEGTPAWDLADRNNQWCVHSRQVLQATNPAHQAAEAANATQGGSGGGDPFRDLSRWAPTHGQYKTITWTDRNFGEHSSPIFVPPDSASPGPFPGIVVYCHVCFLPGLGDTVGSGYLWGIQALAEHGYVVFFASVNGNDVEVAKDATDWFVSTPSNPNPNNPDEFNPYWERLDRDRLGTAGHSGAGGLALYNGHGDSRYDAVVAWDPAGNNINDDDFPELRVPTMVQVADYQLFQSPVEGAPALARTHLYEPRHTKPVPPEGSKYTYFDTLRAHGIDTMQVAPRASDHGDWSGGSSLYGEAMNTYYMLAWFDRYVRGITEPAIAEKALARLTRLTTFDTFADKYEIGSGFFDALKAQRAGNVEAGNVPITVGDLKVRNILSWWYPSRYYFDGGALSCGDMRAGCPS